MSNSLNIEVRLKENGYTIFIEPGILDHIAGVVEGCGLKGLATLITDSGVGPIYADRIAASLGCERTDTLVMAQGEAQKNLETARKFYDGLLDAKRGRDSFIVALGGGVVGDLAGFVAATYLRGVPFVQVPTSLLAQVDSSVGGKVGVDLPQGKNLVGAFYQPKAVVIDPNVLRTLSRRHLANGMAEVIKYGVIWDESFYAYVEERLDDLLALEESALMEIIGRSCRIKADVVEQDEKETSLRIILNYGHTIGHAVETCMEYQGWLHGEALAVGMLVETRISQKLGLTNEETFSRQENLIGRTGLPTRLPAVDEESFRNAILRDKKNLDAKIRMVLPVSIGKVEVAKDVTWEIILESVRELTK